MQWRRSIGRSGSRDSVDLNIYTFSLPMQPKRIYQVEDVFRPTSYPDLTYVGRKGRDVEAEMRQALRSRGEVVSLAGPSKSGKTVLAETVTTRDARAYVNCSHVSSTAEFWAELVRTLDMELGRQQEKHHVHSEHVDAEVAGKFSLKIVESGARTTGHTGDDEGTIVRVEKPDPGAPQVIAELLARKKILIIDDFHYLEREVQVQIGRQLKDAAWQGVPIVIISVPHRGDDPVRAVPDLRGRIIAVGLDYWQTTELENIARVGFPLLGMKMDDESIERLASESLGSPQLMQRLCLEACRVFGITQTLEHERELTLKADTLNATFKRAATSAEYTTVYETLEAGPRTGGDRDKFQLLDGTSGDVYRVILAAIAVEPPRLYIRYDELKQRIKVAVDPVRGGTPTGQAIQRAAEWMYETSKKAASKQRPPQDPVVQWEAERGGVLVLPDPYFVFYVRWRRFGENIATTQVRLDTL